MEKRIELDETKVLEIQNTNLQLVSKANLAIKELNSATMKKDFTAGSEAMLAEVEHHGKELTRALKWWNDEFIGPVVTSAYDLWKMLCNRRNAIADPLEQQKKLAALAVGSYRAAHEADRFEKEDAERKRLEKIAEDERLVQAAELEVAGKKEEAEQLIDAPIFVPPVTMAAPQKTKGVGDRGTWKFEIVNRELIPDEFWMVDMIKLGAQVRLSKDQFQIPGVKTWFEPSASFSVK